MYRVAVFVHLKNVAKLFFLACPFFGKSLFPKTRMSKKGTCACRFGPFWAILGRFMSHFWQKLFTENKKPRFLDMHQPILPQKHGFMASPKKGKSDFLKTRMPQKGTCFSPIVRDCIP
jgi:hypothetical protein